MLTIRDQRNKAITEKLLELIAENYSIIDKFDIIKKRRIKGNGYREMSEPRILFFFLLKKYTSLTFREMKVKLGSVTPFDHASKMVVKAEKQLRNKANMEFIYQVRIIERDLKEFVVQWQDVLINEK